MVFSINKLFHLFAHKARNEASEPVYLQKYHEAGILCGKTLFMETTNPSFCYCLVASQPENVSSLLQLWSRMGHETSKIQFIASASSWKVWYELVSASLWVHVRMCLFSSYSTGCLQPFCVVCPQLHLHLNLVGSLPWVGDIPCPTPHNRQCIHAHTHAGTLLFL